MINFLTFHSFQAVTSLTTARVVSSQLLSATETSTETHATSSPLLQAVQTSNETPNCPLTLPAAASLPATGIQNSHFPAYMYAYRFTQFDCSI